jgi:hypothetical protein
MSKLQNILALWAASLLLAAPLYAAPPKTYQVTGPILEVTDKTIVVQKGDERWEIARDETTKTKGQLKVGQTVTVHYRMMATAVEPKSDTQPKGKTK